MTTAKKTAARKPQDRKPKAGEPLKVTVGGHTYTVPADALDDFELLDDVNAMQDGDATVFPSVLRRLFGDDQYRQALDRLRDDKTGRVSVSAGVTFVNDVFKALNPNA